MSEEKVYNLFSQTISHVPPLIPNHSEKHSKFEQQVPARKIMQSAIKGKYGQHKILPEKTTGEPPEEPNVVLSSMGAALAPCVSGALFAWTPCYKEEEEALAAERPLRGGDFL